MNPWRPVSDPPPLVDDGWGQSKPVLGFDRYGDIRIVIYYPPGWCEETRDGDDTVDATGEIIYWMPLPPPPMGEIADAREKQQ